MFTFKPRIIDKTTPWSLLVFFLFFFSFAYLYWWESRLWCWVIFLVMDSKYCQEVAIGGIWYRTKIDQLYFYGRHIVFAQVVCLTRLSVNHKLCSFFSSWTPWQIFLITNVYHIMRKWAERTTNATTSFIQGKGHTQWSILMYYIWCPR